MATRMAGNLGMATRIGRNSGYAIGRSSGYTHRAKFWLHASGEVLATRIGRNSGYTIGRNSGYTQPENSPKVRLCELKIISSPNCRFLTLQNRCKINSAGNSCNEFAIILMRNLQLDIRRNFGIISYNKK